MIASIFFMLRGDQQKRSSLASTKTSPHAEMKPIHWRRSRIGKYLRHIPRPKHIRGTWVHRIFGDRMFESELWHPTRTRFAAGMAVGAFFSMMPPLPIQMIGAAVIACITRVNVPAALVGTWISNPFTFLFCAYWQYRIGCFLLGREPGDLQMDHIKATLASAPLPYFAGIIPAGILMALISYPLTLMAWDWVTARIEISKKRRAAAEARRALLNALPETMREPSKDHTGAGTP
jgi:uncharacterized protein (DUF2062 family)